MTLLLQATALLLASVCLPGDVVGVPASSHHGKPGSPAADPPANPGNSNHSLQQFRVFCKKFCKTNPCPAECAEAFLDPWTLAKRSVRNNGLTFDDYLFMRWLGRDMIRAGMRR